MSVDTHSLTTQLDRLSRLSVERGHDAFRDVDWDGPDSVISPHDPRHVLPPDVDPFAATQWYQSQPIETQARLGLIRMATCLKVGWHFENLLQTGLLQRGLFLPDGHPEFRYLHHEVIEESQHTLMFNEFICRSGIETRGMPRWLLEVAQRFVGLAARFDTPGFYLLILGGEDPIDHLQRQLLAAGGGHPILRQIMKIHVAEEARHISYARSVLSRSLNRMSRPRKQLFGVMSGISLGIMVRLMITPSKDLLRAGAPKDVVQQSFQTPHGRRLLAECAAKPRRLLDEHGCLGPAARVVWRAMGIWPQDEGGSKEQTHD